MAETPATDQLQDLAKLEKELADDKANTAKPAKPAGKGKEKDSKKKAKAKAKKPDLLWTVRLEKIWDAVRVRVVEIFHGLRSPDRPTRRMSLLFFLCFLGVFAVFGAAIHRYLKIREIRIELARSARVDEGAEHFGEFVRKQAAEAKHKSSLMGLGQFTVELKPVPNQKVVPGVVNMAEVELVIECDSKETREYIEDNLAQARNQVTDVLFLLDREAVLTREGKRKLRKTLIEKLNLWLPKGKVEELYFSKLVVS
jgi:flagellar basal body-associated protein FliL